jgi:hypothetical protein
MEGRRIKQVKARPIPPIKFKKEEACHFGKCN